MCSVCFIIRVACIGGILRTTKYANPIFCFPNWSFIRSVLDDTSTQSFSGRPGGQWAERTKPPASDGRDGCSLSETTKDRGVVLPHRGTKNTPWENVFLLQINNNLHVSVTLLIHVAHIQQTTNKLQITPNNISEPGVLNCFWVHSTARLFPSFI